jgi:hypothetical protein
MIARRWHDAAVVGVAAFTSVVVHAMTFYSTAGAARVVDTQSGQPIEGVIVEASWEITNFRDSGSGPLAELVHAEARTDSKGEFTLPAWGPVTMSLHSHIRSVVKRLDHSQPHLYFYKRGYHGSVEKGPEEDRRPFLDQLLIEGKDRRVAWWDRHTFKLEPNRGSIEERRNEVSLAITALAGCKWVHQPRIAAAYVTEARQLARVEPHIADPAVERILEEKCSDAPRSLSTYLE